MRKNARQAVAAKKFGAVVALLVWTMLAIYSVLPPGSSGQSNTNSTNSAPPSVSQQSAEVERGGFKLKPTGVATDKWTDQSRQVRVDFSLQRSDGTPFRELKTGDMEALLNGDALTLDSDSLQRNTAPTRFLFMLDRSRSMISASQGVNKLMAAKAALKALVDKLGPNDVGEVMAFDSIQDVVVNPTNNKSTIKAGIDSITPRADQYTFLYDAVEAAIREADKNNIKNVIVMSDGWEDTADTKPDKMSPSQFAALKSRREETISRLSRQKGVRVYTIAVGIRGHKDSLGYSYVDYESMCAISNATNGGTCSHVDMEKIQSLSSSTTANQEIERNMKQVLEDIKKDSSYDYSLNVKFPSDAPRKDGKLTINASVDNGKVKLPVVFPYKWDAQTGAPVFGPGQTLKPIFITIASKDIPDLDLFKIYLWLLVPLGFLALVPPVYNRFMTYWEVQQMNRAVIEVGQQSTLIGQQCPNEAGHMRFAFKAGDPIIICPKCGTPHHLSCWDFNQHQCMNRLCEHLVKVPSRIMAKYGIAEEKKESVA